MFHGWLAVWGLEVTRSVLGMRTFPTVVFVHALVSGLLLLQRLAFQVYIMKTWFKLGRSSRSEAQHLSQSWEDGFVSGVCGDV